MNYSHIATTVFTPLELGTVGLSEEAAIQQFGAENIDCVISSFQPLEWSVAHDNHEGVNCTAKVCVSPIPISFNFYRSFSILHGIKRC